MREAGERQVDGEPTTELVAGKAGSPTKTERDAVYDEVLRRGPLPSGWVAQHARLWGITRQCISDELDTARQALDQERGLEGCQVAAHNLTIEAIASANRIDRLVDEPLEREADRDRSGEDLAFLIEARAKGQGERAKVLKMVADIKLRAAASLLAIHRRPVVLESGGSGQSQPPDPNKLKAR